MGGTDDNYPIAVCHLWSKMGQNWENRLKDFLLTGKKMGCSIWPLQSNHIKQQYLKLSKLVRQVWIKYPQTDTLKFSDGSGLVGSKKSFFSGPGLDREFNINAGPSTVFADPARFDLWISGLDATLSGDPSIQKKS